MNIKVRDSMVIVIFIQAVSHLESWCHERALGYANEALALKFVAIERVL